MLNRRVQFWGRYVLGLAGHGSTFSFWVFLEQSEKKRQVIAVCWIHLRQSQPLAWQRLPPIFAPATGQISKDESLREARTSGREGE